MKRPAVVCLILFFMLSGNRSNAQPQRLSARVTDAFGTAQKQSASAGGTWQNISVGDLLPAMTSVKTGDNSAVLLLFRGGHVLRIGSNTTVQLREVGGGKSFSFSILSGRIWSVVRTVNKPAKYEVDTPSAVAGVEGTLFSVFYGQDSAHTLVSANQGTVNLRQGGQSVKVREGFTADVAKGQKSPLAASPSPPYIERMWQSLRKETWVRPGAAGGREMRMDRDVEKNLNDSFRQPAPKQQPHKKPRRKR